jgi:ABC-type microcin C transport system permease subunit YejE
MQYDKLDDKTPIQGSAIRQSSVNDFKQNKEIKKARIIILVLLSVELVCKLIMKDKSSLIILLDLCSILSC